MKTRILVVVSIILLFCQSTTFAMQDGTCELVYKYTKYAMVNRHVETFPQIYQDVQREIEKYPFNTQQSILWYVVGTIDPSTASQSTEWVAKSSQNACYQNGG
jgi:virulence-associated protein VapD